MKQMKKSILISLFLIIALLSSCKKESDRRATETAPEISTEAKPTVVVSTAEVTTEVVTFPPSKEDITEAVRKSLLSLLNYPPAIGMNIEEYKNGLDERCYHGVNSTDLISMTGRYTEAMDGSFEAFSGEVGIFWNSIISDYDTAVTIYDAVSDCLTKDTAFEQVPGSEVRSGTRWTLDWEETTGNKVSTRLEKDNSNYYFHCTIIFAQASVNGTKPAETALQPAETIPETIPPHVPVPVTPTKPAQTKPAPPEPTTPTKPPEPPTQAPTQAPTQPPTQAPAQAPTQAPTLAPQKPTEHQHQFGSWEQTQAPTCTKYGMEKRTCSSCGYEESRQLPRLEHEMGEWQILERADVMINGLEESTCIHCPHKERRTIPALEARILNITFIDPDDNPVPAGSLQYEIRSSFPYERMHLEKNGTPVTWFGDGAKVSIDTPNSDEYMLPQPFQMEVNGDMDVTVKLYARYTYIPVQPTIHAIKCGLIYVKDGETYKRLRVTMGGHDAEGWVYTYTVDGTYVADQHASGMDAGDKSTLPNLYTRRKNYYNVVFDDSAFKQVTPSIYAITQSPIYYKIGNIYEQLDVTMGGFNASGWVYTYSAGGMYIGEQFASGLNSGDACNLSPLYTKVK